MCSLLMPRSCTIRVLVYLWIVCKYCIPCNVRHFSSISLLWTLYSPDDQTLEDDLLTFVSRLIQTVSLWLKSFVFLQFKTNTIGTTHTLNTFLPLIMAGSTKKIIVVTSQMGSPHYALGAKNTFAPCYSISKAALNMVVAKFAAEQKYRDAGLTIVGISPGLMKTATTARGHCKSTYFLTTI